MKITPQPPFSRALYVQPRFAHMFIINPDRKRKRWMMEVFPHIKWMLLMLAILLVGCREVVMEPTEMALVETATKTAVPSATVTMTPSATVTVTPTLTKTVTPMVTEMVVPTTTGTTTPTEDSINQEDYFDEYGCLIPIRNFSFSIMPDLTEDMVVEPLIKDLREWEMIGEIPHSQSNQPVRVISATFHDKETTDLWIAKDGFLFLYNYEEDLWIEFNGFTSTQANSVSIITINQKIWILKTSKDFEENEYLSNDYLFHQYNPDANQFLPINLPIPDQEISRILDYVVNAKDEIWFLVESQNGSTNRIELYSYNTNNQILQSINLDFEPFLTEWYSPLGRILILGKDKQLYIKGSENLLFRFDDTMQQFYQISIVGKAWEGIFYEYEPKLFFDSAERLWIGSQRYLKFDEKMKVEYFFVIPSTTLLHTSVTGTWNWEQPQFLFETPDHRIWFNSFRGIGWVNPDEEKWCVFSNNSYASLIKDENGTLWLIHDGILYRKVY